MIDSPWDEDATPEATREAEWSKMSNEFTTAGYREGITAGKESALQEGFDSGFALVGSPIGREIGILCGISSALLSFLTAQQLLEEDPNLTEARDISSQLARVRFSDIAPPDREAEAHAREHLEMERADGNDDRDNTMDENEELADKRKMEGLEDMLANLTAGTSLGNEAQNEKRPTAEDVRALKDRLGALCTEQGLSINWS
ncbi:hypothetical protein D9758_013420 [Tetrapyrgos nigripes]|uniref:Protein YAE1 n=1 Tax=Tetrapyrgos nigripes TaxID=182062 RepID=A0A8H5FNP6_9AGAR|nr:hypothetical protein D9758_013420 [Tetrapyrgos nigripes]